MKEFRKKVRSLTARLDINTKMKINSKNAQKRLSDKKKHRDRKIKKMVLQDIIASLLADAFDDTDGVDSND